MTALVDHVRYNNITSLEEANISRQVCTYLMLILSAMLTTRTIVQAPPVDDIINGPIRDVFSSTAPTQRVQGRFKASYIAYGLTK
jgi:hypothetical protein